MCFIHKKRDNRGWIKRKRGSILRGMWISGVVLLCILIQTWAFAAEGRYQVIAGSDENAYLVDTSTGAVWILTHRTFATGREPIAIPYKFIEISPKTHRDFIVESAPGGAIQYKDSK